MIKFLISLKKTDDPDRLTDQYRLGVIDCILALRRYERTTGFGYEDPNPRFNVVVNDQINDFDNDIDSYQDIIDHMSYQQRVIKDNPVGFWSLDASNPAKDVSNGIFTSGSRALNDATLGSGVISSGISPLVCGGDAAVALVQSISNSNITYIPEYITNYDLKYSIYIKCLDYYNIYVIYHSIYISLFFI